MILSKAASDDLVDLSIRQFTEAWRLFCSPAPGYRKEAVDDVQYVFSGIPIGFFNVALLTGRNISSERLARHGNAACAWASPKQVPWLFITTEEALAPGTDAAASLDGCGLAPIMRLTGMVAQKVAPAASLPAGLELVVPEDDTACAALLDVNAIAYAMDLEAGKHVIGRRSFWTDHFAVLGLTDGKPATCAAVLMADGHRYVALVATDPQQQRRGFAETAMRRALEIAGKAHGELPSFLHATDAGRPIYERMGYQTVSTHGIFMEKRFLAEH